MAYYTWLCSDAHVRCGYSLSYTFQNRFRRRFGCYETTGRAPQIRILSRAMAVACFGGEVKIPSIYR